MSEHTPEPLVMKTVAHLIAELQKHDPDALVAIHEPWGLWRAVDCVDVQPVDGEQVVVVQGLYDPPAR